MTFTDAMMRGHLARTGHALIAHHEPHPTTPGVMVLVRECCK